MQRAHAIANGVFVVAVNRVGVEGGLEFWGGSFVSDPFGNILAKASADREEVLVVDCDRALHRGDATQLAVPARPPHRRVRRSRQALPRLRSDLSPMNQAGVPGELGYRMPAEWEPHRATWLSWPHNRESWPGKMEPVPAIWARLAGALVGGEDVNILVNDAAARRGAEAVLAAEGVDAARISFFEVPTNDAWMRDHGPTFVVRGGHREPVALIDWTYNSWGGKYPPWDDDDRVPSRLAELLGMPIFHPGIVLEGGSIEVNGAGTLMTTESCLLNPNRNPGWTRDRLERTLADYLGVRHFIWLGDGIVGDDTDGHIDDLTRFVSESRVATVVEDDAGEENYAPLLENLERLQRARDQDGRGLEIVTLPMPPPLWYAGQRLPASYANFYVGNEVVVVPTFDCDRDDEALAVLQACFPGREIVGIGAVDLVLGLGAFHCITQQQPR
jgi:agmatine deiminase